jgi:small subunit ribosomal protein S35
MASAVQSMRLCLRAASRRAIAHPTTRPRQNLTMRPFSSTSFQRQAAAKSKKEEDDDDDEMDYEDYEPIDPAEMERRMAEYHKDPDYEQARQLQENVFGEMGKNLNFALRIPKKMDRHFWADEEMEDDMLIEETDDEQFDEDDITSIGHAKFEEFREYREYARIAAWQMPLLSKLATPFQPPTAQEPLRFRYTSYMGEFHPAESKVVVEFCPKDLPLNEAQQLKLRKLLGPRLNPETDIAKMSCEQFEHQAQNKRYLGDLVNKLIEAAKDSTDMFEDVPLDTRHHTFKVKPKFPKEWRMTEERRKFLEDTRQKALLLDQTKEEEGTLIDGKAKITAFFNASAVKSEQRVPDMATARLNQTLSAPRATQQRQQSLFR